MYFYIENHTLSNQYTYYIFLLRYIDSNNFKLGRGKKFVDYYVGGNDTVSKVHAYITSNAKESH